MKNLDYLTQNLQHVKFELETSLNITTRHIKFFEIVIIILFCPPVINITDILVYGVISYRQCVLTFQLMS